MKTAVIRFAALVLLCGVLCGALGACQPSGGSGTGGSAPIEFAFIGPLTGDYSQYGQQLERGLTLYMDEKNAGGGVGGHVLEMTVFDDKNDAKEAVTCAQKALESDIFALFGPFSSTCGMAISGITNKAQVIHYGITCSHPDFTAAGEWVFSGCLSMSVISVNYARMCYEELGLRRVYCITLNNDWGIVTQDIFKETFEALGGECATEEFVDGINDFTPMLSKAKDWGCDGLFFIVFYANAATMAKQARNLDIDCTMLLSDAVVTDEVLNLASEAVEGAWAMGEFYVDDPRPVWQDFSKRFFEKYPDGTIDMFVSCAYEGIAMICDGIEAVGADKAKVRDWMATLDSYEGIHGNWSFDEKRTPNRLMYPYTIKDGAWTVDIDMYTRMAG